MSGLLLVVCSLGVMRGVRPADGPGVAVHSVGIVSVGADAAFATGLRLTDELVLTVRHAVQVHRGAPALRRLGTLDVLVDVDGEARRHPVTGLPFVSEHSDLAVLRIGPDRLGRRPPPAHRVVFSAGRSALGERLFSVHRPLGSAERRAAVRVLFPFEASLSEVASLVAGIGHQAVRRAFERSYRDAPDGQRRQHFSTRWAQQPTLAVTPFADQGSSGAPLVDARGRIAGMLFAGDPASRRGPVGWHRHEAVLPGSIIRAELAASPLAAELRQMLANSGS